MEQRDVLPRQPQRDTLFAAANLRAWIQVLNGHHLQDIRVRVYDPRLLPEAFSSVQDSSNGKLGIVRTQRATIGRQVAVAMEKDFPLIFGVRFTPWTLEQCLDQLAQWCQADAKECRYVCTPNVDHIVLLDSNDSFREAYLGASMVVADGWPVVTASRWLGRPLPERVAGSDLAPCICRRFSESQMPLHVFLLGGKTGVPERAKMNLEREYPSVQVVGYSSPPLGFEKDSMECQKLIAVVNEVEPDLLILGLGAPKQELWIHRHSKQLRVKVVLCAGGTIDFLAGEQTRAPKWIQKIRMEWLHRLATNPRRLFLRYVKDAIHFPRIFLREWKESKKRK